MSGFPIFVDVSKAVPLIVGGGEVAAIKARLLLKRAPKVEIATDRPGPDVQELVRGGRATLITGVVGIEEIKGRPLVVSALGDDSQDKRLFEIARTLGVPVNVPDRVELCTFSLAAIVDRYPVTVAIGTEGMAPVLATRLRAMFEKQLHPRLGRLASIAAEYRARVARSLSAGVQRRSFWEQVFGDDISRDVFAGDEDEARGKLEALLEARQCLVGADGVSGPAVGRVALVGAGPGDPDLLTLKAVRALKSADVILTDFLVGEGVLEHARREAKIINVGKAPGRHTRTQAEINSLIVSYAKEGLNVVRLKGGDPFVFGRGGEEVEMIRTSGLSCDVVPGITAATAAAASLQIPLTHREYARSVTFISGHGAGDGKPDFSHVNFAALAEQRCSVVAYMAVATAGDLAKEMISAGWSPAMPVIAVERASQVSERKVLASLDVLESDASKLRLKGPALLICGEVAGLVQLGDVETVCADRPLEQVETEGDCDA